jgi:CHAT domain-containing protein
MQLAGAANIVATLWPVGDAHGALFVDELYGELVERSGTVDLAEVVHTVRTRLRSMERAAVLERVAALRTRTADAVARFALERFARDVRAGGARPFEDPYEWAPYFVLGRSQLTLAEVA